MSFESFGTVGIADRVEPGESMRLTRKFIAALVIGVAIVAIVQGYLDYQRERDSFDRQMRSEAAALGRALARGVADVWGRDGEAAARDFLTQATNQSERIQARWVWPESRGHDAPRAPREALDPMMQDEVVTIPDPSKYILLTYIPVDVGIPPRRGALEISQSIEPLDSYIRDSLRNQIAGSVGTILLAAVLALGLGVVFIGRPISRLAAKARRVGTGDLTGPLNLAQRDELGELAKEINLMCDRLADERGAREQATEQLRHADRLTTVGKLASGLAHELGTPLNVVAGRAKLIVAKEVEGEDVISSARIVAEQADRMTALIRQLLDFARPRELHKAAVNATRLAERVVELVQTIARKANVVLVKPSHQDKLEVMADDSGLVQVLANLVVNSIHATPEGGTVTLETAIVDHTAPAYVNSSAAKWLTISVRDTGSGMDDATRERIFEPFFTTKQVGEGTGLGLSVSWGIVREHGGWIDVQTTLNQGSIFTVYLPTGGAS